MGNTSSLFDMAGELIAEYGRHPSNYGRLQQPTLSHTERNLSCGEEMTVDILLSDAGAVKQIAFEAEGRMVMLAAMSLLTEELEGELLQTILDYDQAALLDLLEVETLSPRQLKSALLGMLTLQNLYRKWAGEPLLDFGDILS